MKDIIEILKEVWEEDKELYKLLIVNFFLPLTMFAFMALFIIIFV